jgi:hypothetical protein
MFTWQRTELPLPFDVVGRALRKGPQAWIPDFVEEPGGRVLCTIAISPRLARTAEMGLGAVNFGEGWLTVPVSWRAAETDVLFPVFTGELQAARISDTTTELALVGSYQPPLGPVGELVDHVVMHRVASRALAGFLCRAGELVGAAGSR